MSKECIILAGGLGTRLQSIVSDVPKCMANVANHPFLSYLFDQLERFNFKHVVLALGYKHEIIQDWLTTQNRPFTISFVIEKEPLGTGGAIKYAFSKIKEDNAFVLNGDTFFDIDFNELHNFHLDKDADITLALKKMKNFDRYGSVLVNIDNRIEKFEEKKFLKEGFINGGIYIINKSLFTNNQVLSRFSFEKDILEEKTNALKIYGVPFDNYFIDIGIPSDYEKANNDFLNSQKK